MNLKNKQTGRVVPVPEPEPEIYVGPVWIREGTEPILSSEEIVRRAEEKRRGELVRRELWRSRAFGLLWVAVGLVIWVGILAYFAEMVTQGMRNFLRGN